VIAWESAAGQPHIPGETGIYQPETTWYAIFKV
jgi:hypothetical protein